MAMADEGTKLTGLGKLISLVLIAALVVGGGYIIWQQFGGGGSSPGPGGGPAPGGPEAPTPEAPDTAGVTTVSEYTYVAGERLSPVKGVSQYTWDEEDPVVQFSYNVWAGWLPVISANHGTSPNEDSVFYKKHGFKVELVLMDDPVAARDAYAAGEVHTLWGTADMMVLFAPELVRDSRTAPRIVQQVDWSSGGDGIVVRSGIQNVASLKGKSIALAQNSPSEYYLTSLLLSAGMRPADVTTRYTATAFEAAAAFVADRNVDACVSWAPDIYNIPDRVAGTRILSSTADANKLIADVYAVRADFVRDHPEIVEGLVSGIFEGMDLVKESPEQAAGWMADAFGMMPDEVLAMRADAHPTNFAENVQFFLNASSPTNFERTWKSASYVYRTLGRIDSPVAFDQVMDFSFIKTIDEAGTFAHHEDESRPSFTPAAYRSIPAESPILTQTIRINFYPNSANPYEPARDEIGNTVAGKLYDPNVDATLEQVARLAGQFERAIILVEGHTDSSMKGRVPVQAVRDLSLARAEAIKQALIEKYKFDPDKFSVKGSGWETPADPDEPSDHALNRRVEISVYPPEQT
jgi:NitT/TauT family transport system substrate-binding protein